MQITGTHFNYFQVCKRKLWLFSHDINMEHTSDLVYDGKLIHESTYPQRAERYEEVLVSADYNGMRLNGKIDFFDSLKQCVHEIKRSDKVDEAHTRQLKFYLWLLELNGIKNTYGILEYPKLRKTEEIFLSDADRASLVRIVAEIKELVTRQTCPPTINARICKSCSHYEFCYVEEVQ